MNESHNELVSSRGILKSCEYHPSNPVSSSLQVGHAKFTLPFLRTRPFTLYVCSSALQDFTTNYLPSIKTPFILVSGDSDTTVPNDCIESASILLASPFLKKWYSQNCTLGHPKLRQLPIGLDYHTMSHEPTADGPQLSSRGQETLLKQFNTRPFWERLPKCYGNFHFAMGHRYAQIDRVDAYAHIPPDCIDYVESRVQRKTTWEQMSRYAFVPSPHGNGLDCHRTWEALALGCIPIVRTSPLDPLYADLPVWIVQEWNEVTLENMQRVIETMKVSVFDMKKLLLTYWLDIITNGK